MSYRLSTVQNCAIPDTMSKTIHLFDVYQLNISYSQLRTYGSWINTNWCRIMVCIHRPSLNNNYWQALKALCRANCSYGSASMEAIAPEYRLQSRDPESDPGIPAFFSPEIPGFSCRNAGISEFNFLQLKKIYRVVLVQSCTWLEVFEDIWNFKPTRIRAISVTRWPLLLLLAFAMRPR